MHAFLIVGDNPDNLEKEIAKFVEKNATVPLEFSIDKIEKTRELTSFLKLSQPPKTTIIIRDVDEATVDSLNAFLKNLEEPNENVTFVLTARREFKVIPTILSRCQVIRAKGAGQSIQKEDFDKAESFFESSTGEKLKTIDGIRKREEAVIFLQSLLLYLQEKIKSSKTNLLKTSKYSEISQKTLDAVNQNGNVTMQLTNMVVKIAKATGVKAN